MRSSHARVIFAAILLGFLMVPNLAQAAKEKTKKSESGSEEPAKLCHKGIKGTGLPNKLSTIASLSAIRLWTQVAMKHGENYSMWHNAKSAGVKCEKIKNSDFYRCIASGKPCRAVSLDQATAKAQSN